jgi:hypothetical protein
MDGDVALTWIACMLREIISGVLLYIYIILGHTHALLREFLQILKIKFESRNTKVIASQYSFIFSLSLQSQLCQ